MMTFSLIPCLIIWFTQNSEFDPSTKRGCIDLPLVGTNMISVFIFCLLFYKEVNCHGLLLLYRPRDISSECAFSENLRYDISFGMGMSDTMTLVFRTMSEIDYQCAVDIVTEPADVSIITVIKFPTSISLNCGSNPDAFTVMKKRGCIRICDSIGNRDVHSSYFVAAVKGRMWFQFLSNSSINSDIRANLYQVTVTSAREKPKRGCSLMNETICSVGNKQFCFTSGVVCDGINNCGVTDWFDERKSGCNLPIEKLGFAPVIAVWAALVCALLAAGHILLRCLPPLANSFFIFNANEDNRLCIDPVFKYPGFRCGSMEKAKKISLIPVSSSSSSFENHEVDSAEAGTQHKMTISEETPQTSEDHGEQQREPPRRKTTIRCMTERFQNKFRSKRPAVMHF